MKSNMLVNFKAMSGEFWVLNLDDFDLRNDMYLDMVLIEKEHVKGNRRLFIVEHLGNIKNMFQLKNNL